MAINSANDYGKLEKTAPGMLRALSKWSKPAEKSPLDEEDPAIEEFIARNGRSPGLAELGGIRKTWDESIAASKQQDKAAMVDPEEVKYSNYRTDDGYQLPKGMAMMGEEPQESVEEYLIKNGAREIAGKDPYGEAWQKTVNDWSKWFDIIGGDKNPSNPKFRKVYGELFDTDLRNNQAAALSERNKGMEKITKLLNNFLPAYDQAGTPTPDATEDDVLKGLGVNGSPGSGGSRGSGGALGHQGGIADAFDAVAKKEDEISKKKKEKAEEDAKLIKTHTDYVTNAYSTIEAAAKERLKNYGKLLRAARKDVDKPAETDWGGANTKDWGKYIESYSTSIRNIADFLDNIQTYKDLDINAINRFQAPPNIKKIQDYWKKGIIKYKAGGAAAAAAGVVDAVDGE